ncbi:MAG TPA: hypothetical protein VL484_00445 [Vicinamibacterales bacterium]|nr:hypothetical protein [Vicinamibacterales bacterium]
MFTGPLAWAAVLEINYAMSYVACEQGSKWMLHLAIAAAVVLIALAAYGAWVSLPSAGDETLPSTVADPERTALVRARFVSYAGLGLSFWFIIAILAMEIPAALLQPCNP